MLPDAAADEPRLTWVRQESDPGGLDFPSLSERFPVTLGPAAVSDPTAVAYAITAFELAEPSEVAFAYQAAGAVDVFVDGEAVAGDVHGAGPVPFYALHPWSRQTAAVRLGAGPHVVLFACPRGELAGHDWFLAASVVDPSTGAVWLGATGRPPAPSTIRAVLGGER